MAEEALACFTSLENTIPGWITDLERILTGATTTQTEMCLANKPSQSANKPPRKRLRSITSSLKSSRSKDEQSETRRLRRLSPKDLTSTDALRISQRKRKTDSACSGEEPSFPKFTSKAAAVVYYDGNTQKQFEQLVRAVGSSRNAIRKGKMSAKIESMARTGSSSSSDGYSSGGEGDEHFPFGNLSGKGPRSRHLPAFGRSDNTLVFDKVDAHLERAQALCERAAHQVLRDGDCSTDVKSATEQFLEALSVTKAELPDLRKRANRLVERRKRSEERRRAEKEAEEERRRSATQLTQKILNAVAATHAATDGRIEMDALEVDDGSDDEELNISAIKFSKFTQTRNRRLATTH